MNNSELKQAAQHLTFSCFHIPPYLPRGKCSAGDGAGAPGKWKPWQQKGGQKGCTRCRRAVQLEWCLLPLSWSIMHCLVGFWSERGLLTPFVTPFSGITTPSVHWNELGKGTGYGKAGQAAVAPSLLPVWVSEWNHQKGAQKDKGMLFSTWESLTSAAPCCRRSQKPQVFWSSKPVT